jgi:hypothetical protein
MSSETCVTALSLDGLRAFAGSKREDLLAAALERAFDGDAPDIRRLCMGECTEPRQYESAIRGYARTHGIKSPFGLLGHEGDANDAIAKLLRAMWGETFPRYDMGFAWRPPLPFEMDWIGFHSVEADTVKAWAARDSSIRAARRDELARIDSLVEELEARGWEGYAYFSRFIAIDALAYRYGGPHPELEGALRALQAHGFPDFMRDAWEGPAGAMLHDLGCGGDPLEKLRYITDNIRWLRELVLEASSKGMGLLFDHA